MQLLKETVRKLYNQTGRLNLYICLCRDKSKPDTERLREEIASIKLFIIEIEKSMECL